MAGRRPFDTRKPDCHGSGLPTRTPQSAEREIQTRRTSEHRLQQSLPRTRGHEHHARPGDRRAVARFCAAPTWPGVPRRSPTLPAPAEITTETSADAAEEKKNAPPHAMDQSPAVNRTERRAGRT